MHYLDQPTIEDKENNAKMLFDYMHTNNQEATPPPPLQAVQNDQNQLALPEPNANAVPLIIPNNENVLPQNALIPFAPQFDNNQAIIPAVQVPQAPLAPTPQMQPTHNSNQVVTNQLRQAPVMFQGATFSNCTINMNVPQ